MTARIFVDTNVVVYARDSSEGAKSTIAAEWIARLWRDQSGRTSIQVLNELYVTLTRKLKPGMPADDAWQDVQALMAWDPQPLDRDLLLRAREIERRYRLGWWDSMVVAAAELQECEMLLTEDLQHGMRFDRVRVQNPFKIAVEEPRAAYPIGDTPPSRHRSRGRPRKRAASSLRAG